MSKKDGTIEINCKVKMVTDKALLIETEAKMPAWIPLSQITDQTGEGYGITSVFVPEWIALDKGLI